jgi:hypothetical protein
MPYLNIPKSLLVPTIGKVVGKLEGSIMSTVEGKLVELRRSLEEGTLKCKEGPRKKVDQLLLQILRVKSALTRMKRITSPLRRASRSLSRIILVLKALPVPGFSLTAGITTTFSDTLHLVKEFSQQLNEDADGIDSLISNNNATGLIDSLETGLNNLKTLIGLNCSFEELIAASESTQVSLDPDDTDDTDDTDEDDEELIVIEPQDIESFNSIIARASSKDDISSEVNKLQGILSKYGAIFEQAGTQVLDPFDTFEDTFIDENGRQFTFEIITLSSDFTLAPQRQALARDNTGQVVLSGTPSFASNPNVLIEELKFKITTSL